MKKFLKDFKAFAMKGNIIDMAVGVIIGGAFGKIVTSLVADIVTPFISLLTGSVSLTSLKWVLKPQVLDAAGAVTQEEIAVTYGAFLQNILDFLLIALSIFIVLRIIMKAHEKLEKLKKKEEEKKSEEKKDTELSVLLEIKKLLEKDGSESAAAEEKAE